MGGLAFFGALTYSVNRTLDNEALASADEVAAMVNEDRLPSPIPAPVRRSFRSWTASSG